MKQIFNLWHGNKMFCLFKYSTVDPWQDVSVKRCVNPC